MEASWSAHAAGPTLLHADIRADNLLLTDDGVVVVDWPHACLGAVFVEVVLLAPSVAMQGGPEPAELLARSRDGRSASCADLTATMCALAGYFTERSLRPPPSQTRAAEPIIPLRLFRSRIYRSKTRSASCGSALGIRRSALA